MSGLRRTQKLSTGPGTTLLRQKYCRMSQYRRTRDRRRPSSWIGSWTVMADRRIGIILNGATGRMGTTQHVPNLLAIAAEGGLKLRNGDRLVPDLLIVGRDPDRLSALA